MTRESDPLSCAWFHCLCKEGFVCLSLVVSPQHHQILFNVFSILSPSSDILIEIKW